MIYEPQLLKLSHPQKRIWYIEKMNPGSSIYNIGGVVLIKVHVNRKLLTEAIIMFIKANPGVRIRITEKATEPEQYITEAGNEEINFIDFSITPDPDRAFKRWSTAVFHEPFQLLNTALYHFAVFKINKKNMGIC